MSKAEVNELVGLLIRQLMEGHEDTDEEVNMLTLMQSGDDMVAIVYDRGDEAVHQDFGGATLVEALFHAWVVKVQKEARL